MLPNSKISWECDALGMRVKETEPQKAHGNQISELRTLLLWATLRRRCLPCRFSLNPSFGHHSTWHKLVDTFDKKVDRNFFDYSPQIVSCSMVIEILDVLLFFKIIWIYQEKKTKEIDSPFHYSIVKNKRNRQRSTVHFIRGGMSVNVHLRVFPRGKKSCSPIRTRLNSTRISWVGWW